MISSQPTVSRLAMQTRRRLYLGYCISIGVYDFFWFYYLYSVCLTDFTSAKTPYKRATYESLVFSLICFLGVPFVLACYEGFAASMLSAALYTECWITLIEHHQFLCGTFYITLSTNFMR